MAIVQLKDVVVSRVNRTGHGVKVLEESRTGDKTYKTYFSVWFKEPHGLSEGDKVSLSGFLGAKIGDPWTDREGNERTSVELSVNSPRLSESPAIAQAAGAEWAAGIATPTPAASWETSPASGYTDETPF